MTRNPSTHPVRVATLHDLEWMSHTTAHTYLTDPILTWVYGEDDQFVQRVSRAAAAWRRPMVERGDVWCTEDRTALAAWFWPDELTDRYSHDVESREELTSLATDGGVRFHEFFNCLDGHGPSEPHCILDLICVAETYRGAGRGTSLMQHGMDEVRAYGTPCSVIARDDRNIEFFERFGFAVTREVVPPGGGPKFWMMVC
jgi:GNAT superfamily N-acetyltransferase